MNKSFGVTSKQVSTANQELIQAFKPVGYNDTFATTTFYFVNDADCHVSFNGGNFILCPTGGIEFDSSEPLQTFRIQEAGINYVCYGSYKEYIQPTISTATISGGISIDGICVQEAKKSLELGDTYQLQIIGLRSGLYENIHGLRGATFTSNNTSVCTVSSTGLISYVGAGSTYIEVNYQGLTDIVLVNCN